MTHLFESHYPLKVQTTQLTYLNVNRPAYVGRMTHFGGYSVWKSYYTLKMSQMTHVSIGIVGMKVGHT